MQLYSQRYKPQPKLSLGEITNSPDASNHEQLSPYFSVDQRASTKKKEETSQE